MEEEIAKTGSSLGMKKRRRVMIKRRKNGAATHVYLPIRVTL
jgi:hypothetical protein